MKKIILAFVFLFSFCGVAFADPAPFGFELGKATFKEVARKHPKYEMPNFSPVLNGKVILIKVNEFELEGIRSDILMEFDNGGILHFVGFFMCKDQFDNAYGVLKKKYKLVYEDGSFAEFESGNSLVRLGIDNSKVMVIYKTKKYDKIVEKKKSDKEQ